MRIASILSTVLVIGATLAAAWTKEDHEIFRVKDEIERTEGEGVSFYDYIGVKSPSATLDEINKAFKKASLRMHPDKHKPVVPPSEPGKPPRKLTPRAAREQKRLAQEKYARLLLATKILRENRDRYDHFLRNGFPKWKGTGYYYARFRPGLGSVLVGLFVCVGGGAHYGLMYLTRAQQKRFLSNFIQEARVAAWGPAGVAGVNEPATETVTEEPQQQPQQPEGPRNRRERRFAKRKGGGGPSPDDDDDAESTSTRAKPVIVGSSTDGRRKVQASNGKILIVDSAGGVSLLETDPETGEEVESPLDVDDLPAPKLADTAMVRLPLWLFAQTVGRVLPGARERREREKAERKVSVFDEVVAEADAGDVTSGADEGVVSGSDARKGGKAARPGKGAVKREGLPRRKTPNRGKSLTQMKAEKAEAEAQKAAAAQQKE